MALQVKYDKKILPSFAWQMEWKLDFIEIKE